MQIARIACIALLIILAASLSVAMEVWLRWDANTEPDLAGYKVYVRTLPSDTFVRYTTISGNNTGAKILNIPADSKIVVYVTAFNTYSAESNRSNRVGINIPASRSHASGNASFSSGGGL